MLFLSILFGFVSLSVQADSTTQALQTTQAKKSWIQQDSRWRVFASGLAGYGAASGKDFAHSPDGDQYLLSGVLTYQMPRWVHDMGLGWMSSNLRTEQDDGSRVSIRTRAAVAEYGFRYRLSQRWSIGPELNVAFGTDTSFAPTVGKPFATPFLGARLVYEMPISIFPVRFLTQALTDVNLEQRRVILTMAGIQIGIPVGLPDREAPMSLSQSSPSRVELNDKTVRVRLDPKLFHFYTQSASVDSEARAFLKELSVRLKENESLWSEVQISGHSDQRGPAALNVELSKKRAASVARILKSEGVSNIEVEGLGFTELLDPANTRAAWAKNRRVELTISGVKDPEKFVSELQKFEDRLKDKIWERTSK